MNLTFSVGFILGQLSVIIFITFIFKYFLFADVDIALDNQRKKVSMPSNSG